MGGPKRPVREVVARLSPEDAEEFGKVVWHYEAGTLSFLDDLKERLIAGEFINQKEIADCYGKSAPMARTYIDNGIKLGMWTEDEVSAWFAKGKRRRTLGKTEAPEKPDHSWKDEKFDDIDDDLRPSVFVK